MRPTISQFLLMADGSTLMLAEDPELISSWLPGQALSMLKNAADD